MPIETTATARCDGCNFWLRMITEFDSRTATNRLQASFFTSDAEAAQTALEQGWLVQGDDMRCPRCQKKGRV